MRSGQASHPKYNRALEDIANHLYDDTMIGRALDHPVTAYCKALAEDPKKLAKILEEEPNDGQ